MAAGISLANKCQMLFGFAIVLILGCALSVPWFRTSSLVRDSQWEVARQLSDAWLKDRIQLGTLEQPGSLPARLDEFLSQQDETPVLRMTLVRVEEIDHEDEQRSFLSTALKRFQAEPARPEYTAVTHVEGRPVYRYARAIRESEIRAVQDRSVSEFRGGAFDPDVANRLRAILVIDRTSQFAEGQLLTSRIFIIAAGIVASLLAGLVFHLILTKLILSPVRSARKSRPAMSLSNFPRRSTPCSHGWSRGRHNCEHSTKVWI